MEKIIIFEDKKDCCGCGACMNVCPKKAISMQEDESGFVYPVIDENECVKCGACKRVCGYQNKPEMNVPMNQYAASWKNEVELKKSASGGIFAALADRVLAEGGIVYGAAMVNEQHLEIKHIRVANREDLVKLQGSKYVQSSIGNTYNDAKKDLIDGKKVLFSGTPCQIAGLRKFLGKEYSELITIDIICHGVPSVKMFNDFITCKEQEYSGKIKMFLFRDKSKGQGMNSLFTVQKDDKTLTKVKNGRTLSFFSFFLKSYIYRKNCYSCPFANKERVSDLTLGDYWGFHEEYPNLDSNIELNNEKGVSCILVNTEKGKNVIEQYRDELILMDTSFEKIARHNKQLSSPSKYSAKREEILDLYSKSGYGAVEKYYKKNYKTEIIVQTVASLIPKKFKRGVKKIIGRLR